jgi:DNA-binding beta-propeller fold protein YncE
MARILGLCLVAGFAFAACLIPGRGAAPEPAIEARLRHPVALALSDTGTRLLIANRCGTISTLDISLRKVIGETKVGGRLSDLTAVRDGRLLATDEEAGEVIELRDDNGTLRLLNRTKVPAFPVCVRCDSEGGRFYVSSLWTHTVTIVESGRQRSVEVPFAPRLLLPLAGSKKLLVADSFGGRLAVIDITTAKVDAVHALDAHAIRGMASGGDKILLAHQVLAPRTPTTAEEMHWGNVIRQEVRSLNLASLAGPGPDILRGSDSRPLGEPGRGAGDPAGLAVGQDGTTVVTIGGLGEIEFGKPKEIAWTRLTIGRRPTAVVLNKDASRAFVADTSSDTIVIVDLPDRKAAATVPLGARPELTSAERGEELFYDAHLSREGWMSCQSCHVDGHSNGGLSDTLSDGSFGAPKRVLSLLGVRDTGPWTWIGGAPDLSGQIHKSLQTTMRSLRVREEQVRDLTAYLQTLQPPPTAHAADDAAIGRGREVFNRHSCNKCHAPPLYTTPKTYDVGLHDEVGNLEFNPPSLRGVGQGGPYLHDGRAETLEDVLLRHKHPGPTPIAADEVKDLVIFLRSL